MMRQIFVWLSIAALAGCKVEAFHYQPGGYLESTNGTVIGDYSNPGFSIYDFSFKDTFRYVPDEDAHRKFEFWHWRGGPYTFCGYSTEVDCTIDASPLANLANDHPAFSDEQIYRLKPVVRPEECTGPAELKEIAMSNTGYDRGVYSLCDGEEYTDIRAPFDEPFRPNELYIGDGVVIRNSDIAVQYDLVIFTRDQPLELDRADLSGLRGGHVNGVRMINGSRLHVTTDQAGAEVANVEGTDSSLSVYQAAHKISESEAKFRPVVVRDVFMRGKTASHPNPDPYQRANFTARVYERLLVLKNIRLQNMHGVVVSSFAWHTNDKPFIKVKQGFEFDAWNCSFKDGLNCTSEHFFEWLER